VTRTRLRILMVATGTPGIPPKGGGGLERVIYEFTRSLSKLGHRVTLVDTASSEERDLRADLSFCTVVMVHHPNLTRLHSLPFTYLVHELVHQFSLVFYAVAIIPSLTKLLLSNEYDIIHTHGRYTFIATKFAQFLSGTNLPIILTCHNGSLMKKRYPLWLKIYWVPEWVALRLANRITTMSKALKGAITRFALLDKNAASKIDVIPNGVDVSVFKQRSPRNYSGDIRIVCVSHIVRIKGQKYSIESIKLLRQKGFSNVELLLAGAVIDFDYYKELINLVRVYNLEQKVKFLGEVPHYKIAQLLRDADIAIWPSGVEQGMPLSILEYLASGKPVLCRRSPQLEEILPEGVVVYFDSMVELVQKIMNLLEDESLREELQKRGRDFVESNYDWTKIAKMVEVTYRKTIGETPYAMRVPK